MKKQQPKRSSRSKASNRSKTVDEYLESIKGPGREMLTKMRSTIRSVVPRDATEVISYGIPAFKQKKILVWYAAFAHHCSLFPGGAVLKEMKDEIEGFVTSKGTIQFPIEKPLPVALVKQIVKKRLAHLRSYL